ncbi:hypothetical protein [Litoribacillus peritrichatus]|uniref:Cytochrome c domain-containing protein n=1 Tax=Litoribacillus peritrichatus TaxID=718191 RepID=A0ABP7MQW4_9GAMM
MRPFQSFPLFVVLCSSLILSGCGGRDDTEVEPITVDGSMTPDSFLTPINTQSSITAGQYQVVVSPETDGQTGSYQLTVSLPDGTAQTFTGSWPNTAATRANNPSHELTFTTGGALNFQLTSTVPGHLYLVKNDRLVAEQAGTENSLSWRFNASGVSSEQYAQAYYRAVDPSDERTTLADWKNVNGFGQGGITHVTFRDTKDLGYGRDMYARQTSEGGLAFYVDNYVVILREGSSANYGPLNLDAALAQDSERHIGSNAIEFSRLDPDDPDSPRILKFFTFAPEDRDGVQQRITAANLDGRGIKYMPTMCLVCHGGTMLPLEDDGTFPVQTLLSAKFNRLEPESFEYGDEVGQTRNDLEDELKLINSWIHQSYVSFNERDSDTQGKWDADFAIEIMEGHYGGEGLPNARYDSDSVPSGWRASFARPEGVELLYSEVVEPHCISCHSLRGTEAGQREQVLVDGELVSLANAINFASYEQFISYSDRIIEYVFRRGVMPLSLRNYEKFWQDPEGPPSRLAAFLPGFNVFNANREVEEPGKPFARPGENRTVQSPVQLNASESLFATGFEWSVTNAPVGASYNFNSATSVSPVFSADTDGDYTLSLTVNNGSASATATTVLTIDSSVTDQTALTFVDHIRPIMGSDSLTNCSSCHNPTTGRQGIPVYYDDSNPNQYRDVLARVNLAVPEDSLLLIKPTNQQHGGDIQINRNTLVGEANYQTLLNWIREGAVCGTDVNICPE